MRPETPFQFNPEIKIDTFNNESEIHLDISERRLQMVDNLDRYITSHETSEHSRVLRDRQMTVFMDIKKSLEEGNTEGYVEAPTGFGKTILFSEIIKAIDQRTLVIVPSKVLVEQTYERFKQFNPDSDLGRFFSENKESGNKVIITTYDSLVRSSGGVNPEDIDLLILDEAHRSLTGARIDAIGKFSNAIKLGFTATPEYSPNKKLDKLLNNKIHNITLKEAVETGLLSSFSVYLAETEIDISKVSITNNGDYDPKELEAAINIQSRNKSAVELYQKLVEKNSDLSKAVVNCVSVRHAADVARIFQEAGIGAEAIYGDQDQKEKDGIIEKYKEGQLQVLTNVNILTEGFDVPDAALAINLRPTLSKVMAKQRGGRILRLDSENPNKHGVIVDYLDKNKRNFQVTFAQVAEEAQIINPVESGIKQQEEKERQEKEPKETIDKLPLQIEGLNVITNTQEVLRVVKELEKEKNEISQITPTDFLVTASSLSQVFIGGYEKLKLISDEVIKDIKKENPNIVQMKLIKKAYITTVTDRERFIQGMLNKGVELRQVVENIQAGDFHLSYENITSMFEGRHEKVMQIGRDVIKNLKESNPDIFALRKNKNIYMPVITDLKPFIEEMQKRNIKLKISNFQKIDDNDIIITRRELSNIFIRSNEAELKDAAHQVFEEIKTNNPELIQMKKNGSKTVSVITDKNRFITEMEKRGFIRKDESIKDIQPTDFNISINNLLRFFAGNTKKLLKAAQDISKERTELIIKRKNQKGTYSDVATDKDLFIRLMQEKGIKIRPNTPQ